MIEMQEGEHLTPEEYLHEAAAELRLASDLYRGLQKALALNACRSAEVGDMQPILALFKHLGDAVHHVVTAAGAEAPQEKIRIHLQEGATLARNRDTDVGYDLRALIVPGRAVPARGSWVVRTGVHLELPTDVEAEICPRSGLTKHHNVVAGIGVVDPGFRGELEVVLFNHTDRDYPLLPGERVAQLVFRRVLLPEFEVVSLDVLAPSERGMLGHGSSGRL